MLAELAPFVVLAVVIFGFALVIRHMRSLKKKMERRGEELEIALASAGYFPSPAADRVASEIGRSPRFEGQQFQLNGLLAKDSLAGLRYVLDYQSRRGSSGSSTDRGTLFGVRLTSRQLPRFVFRHSSIKMPGILVAGLDKLVTLRYPGFERVPLEGVSPDLTHSLLHAENRDAGVRLLSADVIEVLSRHDGWGVESTGSWLLAEHGGHGRATSPDVASVAGQVVEFDELADAFEV